MPASEGIVTILHFNDVYNVEPQQQEPIGGATRFCAALKSFGHLDPLILFSGDILAPSIMSTFTKGEQMIPVLICFGVHCACYGNHDFDFGVDNLTDFAKLTPFPWLISNAIDNVTDQLLADGKATCIMERNGKKFGLMGLAEEEWLATLATIDPEVTYIDFVTEGRKLAKQLKDKVNRKFIIKSGTDFREFSKITLGFGFASTSIDIERIEVTSNFEEDEELKQQLLKYQDIVAGKMDEVLGHFSVDLDGWFSSIRTQETNIGNFVCDVMLSSTHADLTFLNSGTLRSDRISKGDFTLRDLVTLLPMMDPLIVLNATGEQIWLALENGVSQYPKLEGRFPQVSGVSFAFDPKKPSGSRIDSRYFKIGDEYLDLTQKYRLVTKMYMHQGRDGYDIVKDCDILNAVDWEWKYHRYKWHTGHNRVPALHYIAWRDNHVQISYSIADPESWEWIEKEFRPSVAGRRSFKYRPYGPKFRPWFNRNHQERRPQMGLAPRPTKHPPVPSTNMRMPVNRIANPVTQHQKLTNASTDSSSTGQSSYECDICQCRFTSLQFLNKHKRMHRGKGKGRRFPCSLCPYSTDRISDIKHHMLTHSGDRPHKCFHCGKSFKQKIHLKVHFHIHTGERPFSCDLCSKSHNPGRSKQITLDATAIYVQTLRKDLFIGVH